MFMDWFIVYKSKATRGSLQENLQKAGISYYIPIQKTERFVGDRMVEKEEHVLNNLIFVQTDENITTLTKEIDGLKAPYRNGVTGKPATVKDSDLQKFKSVLEARSLHAEFLPDAYKRFADAPRVRVKAGIFEGLEGRVFRIRHDRKLIINLDDMAIAVSGIHHTLLEIIE